MWFLFMLGLLVPSFVVADTYERYDKIPLLVNRIGPFNNPSETYKYYSLPFCKNESAKKQSQNFREDLAGDRKIEGPYDIRFLVNQEWRQLCVKTLSREDVVSFERAIDQEYYFEAILDGLPIWGYIGEHVEEESGGLLLSPKTQHFLYTHLHFDISYNKNEIIAVNITTNPFKRVDITDQENMKVRFSYSVNWVETSVLHKDRMKRYAEGALLPSHFEVHWASILNSFLLVVLLIVVITWILIRTVRSDFVRYMTEDEDVELGEEETGWKLLHGDVFRFPSNVNILCSVVGAGMHLVAASAIVISLCIFKVIQANKRGAIPSAMLITYSLCSVVGGAVSARLYRQLKGTNWVWNIVLTSVMFPLPCFLVFLLINSAAVQQGSTSAIPIGSIFFVLSLYVLVSLPLSVLSAITSRRLSAPFQAPCRVSKKIPRQIPPTPWYGNAFGHMFVAGVLPFSAMFIELHYIFGSVWGHHLYGFLGILGLALLLAVLVDCLVSVALTYFQLALEDHRWWWRSFLNSGAVSLFLMAFGAFYYYNRSEMSGFLQGSFYFGYTGIVAYAVFLMMGAIGFLSSLQFVKFIYRSIKVE